jgi:Tfp pilus assembly PilM family ATPase
VDVAGHSVKIVQLCNNGTGTSLVAGGIKNHPDDVKPGTAMWQRWAIGVLCDLTASRKFHGKDVIAAVPPNEVFIDHIRMPKIKNDADEAKLLKSVMSKMKQKLPFEAKDAMIKCIPAEEHNALVVAADRNVIDRHLAIYENAGLHIRSMCIWPLALTKTYSRFFGRRKVDVDTVVMLLDINADYTNVVICRHENPLYARSIPIGTAELADAKTLTTLVLELAACKRQFSAMYKKPRIERLIFLSTQADLKQIYTTIAKQLEMPAQVGDCLAAVKMADPPKGGIDRRDCQLNWATAFGLSLS